MDRSLQINPQSEWAWNNKGIALRELKEYKKAIKCFDQAIHINPQYLDAWDNRVGCLLDAGRFKEALKNHDEALQHQNPQNPQHQKICGYLYSSKGFISLGFAEMQSMPNERRYYRERAENSYQLALGFFLFEPDPVRKFQAFPEQHLEVCRDLIKVYRYTRPNEIPEMIRQVNDLLARFLANPDYPASRKIAIQRKLADYQQLRIDDLIQSDKTIDALELAEQRKNDCLRWLFSIDNQKIINPQFDQIQTLLNSNTAVIYWHISPTAISTFILKHQQNPIVKTVLFQATNQTDNLQRFEKWLDQWLENYDDYCQQPKNQTKQPDYSKLSFELDPGGIKFNFGQLKQ
ncbi:MAG: tetratricopeptide repeat protein, partial [Microcoleaceae cyanobacterium]